MVLTEGTYRRRSDDYCYAWTSRESAGEKEKTPVHSAHASVHRF